MPSIRLAKNIGFCSGVKRAIDIVEKTLSKSRIKVYSLGPVIHNPQVIKQLEEKNLCIVNSLNNVEDSSTVILPCHGSPRHILNTVRKKKFKFIDVTCPNVSSVQRICDALYKQGLKVIIIGDREHPELKALMDFSPGARAIERITDIKENEFSHQKIGIISQTTQAKDKFFEIISEILKKNPMVLEVHIFNTICLDTARRQEEVKLLAKAVDVLLVIGSSTSANTKRLCYIGRKINKKTYLIEKEVTSINKVLKNVGKVGLISGASTPDWLVKGIVKKIKEISEKFYKS